MRMTPRGSTAADLLNEAPEAELVPYRYPRPDMNRLKTAIERAAKAGARILAMPLGSRKPQQWTAFAAALADESDYYLWLNDDTTLYPQTLETLIKTHLNLNNLTKKDKIIIKLI